MPRLAHSSLTLAFVSTLIAADEQENYFEMSLEQLLQVKVNATTRTDISQQRAPSSVTVLTREEIQRLGVDSLEGLMNLIAGFQSHRDAGTAAQYVYSVRGRRVGRAGAEVLILIDGVRRDEPRSGGSVNAIPLLPLHDIARVEFVRGPGSAVYGSNAMMGIVNIITVTGARRLDIASGSFNRHRLNASWSHDGDWQSDVSLAVDRDDGDDYTVLDSFSAGTINTSDPHQQSVVHATLSRPSWRLLLQDEQMHSQEFYSVDTLSPGFNRSNIHSSAMAFEQTLSFDQRQSHWRVEYNRTNFSFNTQAGAEGSLAPISQPSSRDPLLAKVNASSQEQRFAYDNNWNVDADRSVQFGLEWRRIHVDNIFIDNNFDIGDLANHRFPIRYYGQFLPTTILQPEESENVESVYGQYQQHFLHDWDLTFGLRYDHYGDGDHSLSPRAALVYAVSDTQHLKLLYGEAFRTPTLVEKTQLNNPVLQGNPDLRAETVRSAELLWQWQTQPAQWSLSYFENHYDGAIVQVAISNTLRSFANLDESPTKGWEAEGVVELTPRVLLRINYTHLRQNSDSSFREARRFGSVLINYQHERWNLNVAAVYRGTREQALVTEDQRYALASYWMWQGKWSYQLNPQWGLYLQAKNLNDSDYSSSSQAISPWFGDGVPHRGREWLLGLSWQY